jgi:hypothetical protein
MRSLVASEGIMIRVQLLVLVEGPRPNVWMDVKWSTSEAFGVVSMSPGVQQWVVKLFWRIGVGGISLEILDEASFAEGGPVL